MFNIIIKTRQNPPTYGKTVGWKVSTVNSKRHYQTSEYRIIPLSVILFRGKYVSGLNRSALIQVSITRSSSRNCRLSWDCKRIMYYVTVDRRKSQPPPHPVVEQYLYIRYICKYIDNTVYTFTGTTNIS